MQEGTKRFLSKILPVIVYLALVFTFSSLPSLVPPRLGFSWEDKVYHFAEYAGLAFLLFRAFGFWPKLKAFFGRALLTLMTGAAIGAIDELHQVYIPGRASQFGDWLADVGGLVFAIIIIGIGSLLIRSSSRLEA
jgi:VanZ family protein